MAPAESAMAHVRRRDQHQNYSSHSLDMQFYSDYYYPMACEKYGGYYGPSQWMGRSGLWYLSARRQYSQRVGRVGARAMRLDQHARRSGAVDNRSWPGGRNEWM